MTNDGPAADPNAPSTSDAWRFDYRLTGWARESHNAAVYCVAFCGKGGTTECEEGGEEEEEEEGGGGDEGGLPLDRVFASAGSRRITVYYAPALAPSPSPSSSVEDAAAGKEAGETAETRPQRRQQQLQERRRRRQQQGQKQQEEQQQLPFSVLQTYVDAAADEEFYVCKWARRQGSIGGSSSSSRGRTKRAKGQEARRTTGGGGGARDLPLLLAGGRRGTLRVLDPALGGLAWSARGHGGPINDIAAHPTRPALALTASRDQSARLWNLEARCCVACFAGGDGAHVAEVLSVDWHPVDPLTFVSCGFDSGVKVWSLEGISGAVEESFLGGGGGREGGRGRRRRRRGDSGPDGGGPGAPLAPFAPRVVPSPRFSSQRVHSAVADCVRFLGPGVLLSKTVDDRVLVWGVEGLAGLPCPLRARGGAPSSEVSAGGPSGAPAPAAAAAASASAAAPPHTAVAPPPRPEEPRVRLLNSLRLSKADDVYFVRFSLDARGDTLACGGKEGRVCVFDPRRVPLPAGGPAEPRKKLRCAVPRGVKSVLKDQARGGKGGGGGGGGAAPPPHPSSAAAAPGGCGGGSVVRQTALSDDGSTLLASCDDGTIWRFDRPRHKGGGEA